MRGKTILLINFILSLVVFIMFLPFWDGYLAGFIVSGWIVVFALVVLIFLFLSLIYAFRTIFTYKVFRTAGNADRLLLLWPFFLLITWIFFLVVNP